MMMVMMIMPLIMLLVMLMMMMMVQTMNHLLLPLHTCRCQRRTRVTKQQSHVSFSARLTTKRDKKNIWEVSLPLDDAATYERDLYPKTTFVECLLPRSTAEKHPADYFSSQDDKDHASCLKRIKRQS